MCYVQYAIETYLRPLSPDQNMSVIFFMIVLIQVASERRLLRVPTSNIPSAMQGTKLRLRSEKRQLLSETEEQRHARETQEAMLRYFPDRNHAAVAAQEMAQRGSAWTSFRSQQQEGQGVRTEAAQLELLHDDVNEAEGLPEAEDERTLDGSRHSNKQTAKDTTTTSPIQMGADQGKDRYGKSSPNTSPNGLPHASESPHYSPSPLNTTFSSPPPLHLPSPSSSPTTSSPSSTHALSPIPSHSPLPDITKLPSSDLSLSDSFMKPIEDILGKNSEQINPGGVRQRRRRRPGQGGADGNATSAGSRPRQRRRRRDAVDGVVGASGAADVTGDVGPEITRQSRDGLGQGIMEEVQPRSNISFTDKDKMDPESLSGDDEILVNEEEDQVTAADIG